MLPMFLPLLSGYYVNISRRQNACLTFGGSTGILVHEFQVHLSLGVTNPVGRTAMGHAVPLIGHRWSPDAEAPTPWSKNMTYEAKLAAQEILALPDRELLQPVAANLFLDVAAAQGGTGGTGGTGGAGGPFGQGGQGGQGGGGGDAAAAQSSDLEFGDSTVQQP